MQIYSTTWNVFRQISTTLNSLKVFSMCLGGSCRWVPLDYGIVLTNSKKAFGNYNYETKF